MFALTSIYHMSPPFALCHVVSSSPLLFSHLLLFLLDHLSLSLFSGLSLSFSLVWLASLVGGAGFDSFDSNPFLPSWSVRG
jgi:hypothetical protein